MKRIGLLILFFFFQQIYSQQVEDAWVFFRDKPQAATFMANPLLMLSQRALDRRTRHQIAIDEIDVPVDTNYLAQILSSPGITYRGKSKWLNAVHITGSQSDIDNLINFNFVEKIEYANKNLGIITSPFPEIEQFEPITNRLTNYDYGQGFNQINMMNGEIMHQHNYTGQGVLLAVIDAGFQEVNTASIFQHLFQNNNIIDRYNFVDNNNDIYQHSSHGTAVLSVITADSNGTFVGTAPDVDIALYISEDVNQEAPIEETYWAEAAERADSIGVDLINTSLGYNVFDRAEYNYNLSDLDGNTSFISRAAGIAVSRGMVVVIAAGNTGMTYWDKILMPADAPGVITVGAVDNTGLRAGFSSIGPTTDGRIKPDVMAQGEQTTIYWYGSIQTGSGTSFSSPLIAGMIACMIQADPTKTPAQIKQDLLAISDRHTSPDNEYGYGIPDFSLYNFNAIDLYSADDIKFYPNPVHNKLFLSKDTNYRIYTMEGKLLMSGKYLKNRAGVDLGQLPQGIYYLSTDYKNYQFIVK